MTENNEIAHDCKRTILAVHDVMDVIGGKWKISIVAALIFGKRRYSDILKEVNGISGKMLSRELKEMEADQLISRTVMDTHPVTVQYELTEYGETLKPVINHLAAWGFEHRKRLIG